MHSNLCIYMGLQERFLFLPLNPFLLNFWPKKILLAHTGQTLPFLPERYSPASCAELSNLSWKKPLQ